MSDAVSIPNETPILKAPRCPVGKVWPIPVHQRLDELVELANESGERTSGTELLAAIVYNFDPKPEATRAALRQYRTSRAGDHAIKKTADVLTFTPRKPGRPAAR